MPTVEAGTGRTGPDPRLVSRTQDHLFGFLRGLRAQGLSVPANKQIDFFTGIETISPSTTGQLYWVGAATLVTSEPGRHIYDEVFRRFFGSTAGALVVTDEPAEEADGGEEDQDDEPTAFRGRVTSTTSSSTKPGGCGLAAGGVSPTARCASPAPTPGLTRSSGRSAVSCPGRSRRPGPGDARPAVAGSGWICARPTSNLGVHTARSCGCTGDTGRHCSAACYCSSTSPVR